MGMETLLSRLRRRREILAAFRAHAAGTPEMARSLDELGLRDSMMLRSLLRQGVLVREQGRYHLDDRGLIRQRMNRVKWGMILLFLLVGLIFLYLNR